MPLQPLSASGYLRVGFCRTNLSSTHNSIIDEGILIVEDVSRPHMGRIARKGAYLRHAPSCTRQTAHQKPNSSPVCQQCAYKAHYTPASAGLTLGKIAIFVRYPSALAAKRPRPICTRREQSVGHRPAVGRRRGVGSHVPTQQKNLKMARTTYRLCNGETPGRVTHRVFGN